MDRKQVRNAFELTSCKHLDVEIKDKTLKLNAQIERAYPGEKPDWNTDPYCFSGKTESELQIPETLYHTLVNSEIVQDAVVSRISSRGNKCQPHNDNSPEHRKLLIGTPTIKLLNGTPNRNLLGMHNCITKKVCDPTKIV